MNKEEETYRKMMNAGYLIGKYDPELYQLIEKSNSPNPYLKAFLAADKEVSNVVDKSTYKIPDWLGGDKVIEKENEPIKDKGKDKGIVPDI